LTIYNSQEIETSMCRNIKRLRRPHEEPTDQELHDAALQFVRKISGFSAPSKANELAFNEAVLNVAGAGRTLFRSLKVRGETQVSA
jgi:hypothetical protein